MVSGTSENIYYGIYQEFNNHTAVRCQILIHMLLNPDWCKYLTLPFVLSLPTSTSEKNSDKMQKSLM